MSAQLHQQLAQKGTDLSSAEQELTRLRQELSQAQQSKHEAMRVKLVLCVHNDNILHMATGLYHCNCLPSIKLYAVPTRVQFVGVTKTAARRCKLMFMLGFLMSSAGGSEAFSPAAEAA